MYAVHLKLIGKLLVHFLLVIFPRCFRFITIHAFGEQTGICVVYSQSRTLLRDL